MNTKVHLCAVILFAFLESGCMTNVSGRPPFNQYVGKTFKTKATTMLYYDGAYESNSEAWFSPPKQVLYLGEIPRSHSDYRYNKRAVILPPGQAVRLLEVREDVGDGSVDYDAIGEVYVPDWKRYVRFHHYLGSSPNLENVPWR